MFRMVHKKEPGKITKSVSFKRNVHFASRLDPVLPQSLVAKNQQGTGNIKVLRVQSILTSRILTSASRSYCRFFG